jgi:hypothetical protein
MWFAVAVIAGMVVGVVGVWLLVVTTTSYH